MKKPAIFAVFIAYNAERTLKKFFETFPKHLFDEIILVDDASQDGTYELAKSLGIKTYKNEVNLGYGGNMKMALKIGLQLGGDVFVDIHPDGEYLPSCIPAALKKVEEGAWFVLGNRFSDITTPLKSGMYFWKFIPIVFLNLLARLILQTDIKDFHQGFRVYTRKLLEKNRFENYSNGYLFSIEMIVQAIFNKVSIAQVPVETHYAGKKRGARLKHSFLYTAGTIKILLLFLAAKAGIRSRIFS